jgi:hypothetical protein
VLLCKWQQIKAALIHFLGQDVRLHFLDPGGYLLSPLGSQSSSLVAAGAASSNSAAHRSFASLHPAPRALGFVKQALSSQ